MDACHGPRGVTTLTEGICDGIRRLTERPGGVFCEAPDISDGKSIVTTMHQWWSTCAGSAREYDGPLLRWLTFENFGERVNSAGEVRPTQR